MNKLNNRPQWVIKRNEDNVTFRVQNVTTGEISIDKIPHYQAVSECDRLNTQLTIEIVDTQPTVESLQAENDELKARVAKLEALILNTQEFLENGKIVSAIDAINNVDIK